MFKSLPTSTILASRSKVVRISVASPVCAALLFLCFGSSQGKADSLPNTAYRGPLYYVSKDMDPIIVEFVPRPWQFDTEKPSKTVVNLPRAYVNFVHGYSHSRIRTPSQRTPKSRLRGWKVLPETVLTDKIMVSLTDPKGEPYTVDSISRTSTRNEDGIAPHRAAIQTAMISLFSNAKDYEPYWLTRAREKNRTLIDFEGLLYDPGPAPGHLYYNTGAGALKYVRCIRSPERARIEVFCTYTLNLGDHFLANVNFLDFRLHGGRSYIVERLSVFLSAMCQYFPCSQEDLLVLSD